MLNVQKVKGRMAELGLRQGDVAVAWDVAKSTACQKLNCIRPIDLDEAEELAQLLEIPREQFADYFFSL